MPSWPLSPRSYNIRYTKHSPQNAFPPGWKSNWTCRYWTQTWNHFRQSTYTIQPYSFSTKLRVTRRIWGHRSQQMSSRGLLLSLPATYTPQKRLEALVYIKALGKVGRVTLRLQVQLPLDQQMEPKGVPVETDGSKVLRPVNKCFCEAMDHHNYELSNISLKYDDFVAKTVVRCA